MLRAFFFCLVLSIPLAADELTLVQLTDVHGGGPHYSEEAFREAAAEALKLRPDALLLTGDFGDNSFDIPGFDNRFREALQRWREPVEQYPGPLYFAVGNDDFAHNYQTQPQDLRQTYAAFKDVFGDEYYLDVLGNGRAPGQTGGFVWLSLNSQIFSRWNQTAQAPEQALASLDWLEEQLRHVAQPVVLLTHIAPSWDLYSRKAAWKLEHIQRLSAILDAHPGQVVILAGHYHRNHVQAIRPRNPVPILTAGALATKYGYQPNWREYHWRVNPGQSLEEVQYTVHYPGHSDWDQPFQFLPAQIGQFFTRLQSDGQLYQSYVRNIYGNHEQWPTYAADPKLRADLLDELWVSPQTPVGVPR